MMLELLFPVGAVNATTTKTTSAAETVHLNGSLSQATGHNESDLLGGVGGGGFDWSFISVLVFVIAGTLGNILVCLAVWLERPLQNVTNWFLVSLAFADLIVSTIVMPFGATAAFLGRNTYQPTQPVGTAAIPIPFLIFYRS